MPVVGEGRHREVSPYPDQSYVCVNGAAHCHAEFGP
jgi:hypothetical protein